MDDLIARGWSYAVGFNADFRCYVARAWKPRIPPLRTPDGLLLVLHSLSESGATADEAAAKLIEAVSARERSPNSYVVLSEVEKAFINKLRSWNRA